MRRKAQIPELPELANPIQWEQATFERVGKVRFINCYYYLRCLSYAAFLNWTGWSCRRCSVWAKAEAPSRRKEALRNLEKIDKILKEKSYER